MGRYMMSFALLGAFLVAAPAVKADVVYEWRSYFFGNLMWDDDDESTTNVGSLGTFAEPVVKLTKGGGDTVTNGTISGKVRPASWYGDYGTGWTVEEDYQGHSDQYWISFNGEGSLGYGVGIVLHGSIGSPGSDFGLGSTGLLANVSLEVNGTWYSLATLISNGSIQSQSYYDDEDPEVFWYQKKTDSTEVNEANDSMVTLLCSDLFLELLGYGDDWEYWSGGFGVRIAPDARDMRFAVVVFDASPVPEPATLGIIGAGVAGLGLARRKRK